MKSKVIFTLSSLFILLTLYIEKSTYAQNWPMINLCRERTSWATEETVLYPPLQKKTEYSLKSNGTNIDDFSFYNNLLCISVQNEPNTLEVFDVESGDTLWTFQVPNSRGGMNFTCAQNDSLIFAGGQYGLGLYALDRETGQQIWYKPIGTLSTRNIILDGNHAYILGDSLYCLNIKDGTTIWSHIMAIQGTPAVDDFYVYVVGIFKIQIFNKFDGNLLWETKNSQRTSGTITVDDHYFYTLSNDTVFSYNKESRDINWIYQRPGVTLQVYRQNTIAITDSKLCFTIRSNEEGNGQLVTLNKATGEFLWERTFTGDFVYTPVIANGVVYVVPGSERALYGFNLENGEQLFYDKSSQYDYQPIVADHKLYIISTYKVVVFENTETEIDKSINIFPHSFKLMQNYPNPFNPKTTIKFILQKNEFVTLKIYNNLGEEIHTLVNEKRSSGLHTINFDGSDFTSGLYFYKIVAGSFVSTKKFLLLK